MLLGYFRGSLRNSYWHREARKLNSSSHHSDSDIHYDEYIYWLYKQGRVHLYVGQTLSVQLPIEIEP